MKYFCQWTIWGHVRFKSLYSSIQKRDIDSSEIAQFLDVLYLGTLFCVVFIIVQYIESKSMIGVRASEGRAGFKMDIGGEGGACWEK